MKTKSHIPEKFAQFIWENQYFYHDKLRLTNGYPITINHHGQFNEDDGPDFKNAEIVFDEESVAHGDIEIHLKATDWIEHNHHEDPAYNNVTLHVVMWDEGYLPEIRKQNGKFLPALILSDYLDRPIGKIMQLMRKGEKIDETTDYPCQIMETEENLQRLRNAGQRRFMDKVTHFERVAHRKNWQQALYEGLMTAMGYSKNKWQFAELARKVPFVSLINLARDKLDIQAILFGVAGLLPHQMQRNSSDDIRTQNYVAKLESNWRELREKITAISMSHHQWIFSGQRPPNFPTARIGQAGVLLDRLAEKGLFNSFYEIIQSLPAETHPQRSLYKQLAEFFISDPDDYWTTHYTLWGNPHKPSKNLLGKSRQKAIVLNILLPLFYSYARMTEQKELRDLLWEMYNDHPSLGKNRITKYQSKILNLSNKKIKNACLEQGLIYVYQNACFQKLCPECILVK